ncbi:MAG: FAD-binding protein [Spirochaetia bacterium]
MSYIEVDKGRCDGCGKCLDICNYDAVTIVNGKAVIDQNLCVMCKACARGCEMEAVSITELGKDVDLSGYKGIWVIVEYFDEELKNTCFQLLSKANELSKKSKEKVTAVLVGNTKPNEEKLQKTFSEYGVKSVKVLTNPDFNRFITEDAADAVSQQILAEKPKIVLFLGTIFGRSIAPQVATRVKTGLTADCTELELNENNNLLQIRPTYGGKVLATIETPYSCPQMASVRPNVFEEQKKPVKPESVKVKTINIENRSAIASQEIKKILKIEEGDGILETPLDEAKVIFCAGFGVGSREGVKMIEDFARENGAVFAATRAVVDEGWADFSKQVGQTGISVRPELYVSFGVSGAIHHIIGMKNSRKIVAINIDPRAPIFKIADYCIVADLFEVLEKIQTAKVR